MAKPTELLIDLYRSLLPADANPARRLSRRYQAAKASRLQSDWVTAPTSENYELRQSLRVLRARAREQARNNGIFKHFLTKARTNVVGSGIGLQCRARFGNGSPNTRLNSRVEALFNEWARRENCSMSGKFGWTDAQRVFITRLLRDGEVLVQKVSDPSNKFGFALHFIDADYLDESYSEIAPNGNRIIMSVEVDAWGRPVAYHLTTPSHELFQGSRQRRDRRRVEASQFIHAFLLHDDPDAARGKTAFHTALRDAKDVEGYKVGVISSARAAAYSFGMLRPPVDEGAQYDEGAAPPVEIALEPLTIQEIPPGYEFVQFDPKQPTQNHAQFYSSIMQDLAVSLDLHYFSLTGDLSAVNYSSARVGLLEERDVWRDLQDFVAENLCREVYRAWLSSAVLKGMVTTAEAEAVREPSWRPRGWGWIDPLKEVNAKALALQNNLTTLTETLAEEGRDLEEHFQTIAAERRLAAQYGIDLYPKAEQQQQQPAPDDDATE